MNSPDLPPNLSSTPSQPPLAAPNGAPAIQGDNTGGVIPYKNPQALFAYYIGLFALIPLLGLAMGPAAVVLGLRGLKYHRENPVVKGQAHAWIGIVLGGMWTAIHWIALIVTVVAMLSSRR
jgi:hypothetical protein